jgi:hypothetical protein
VRLLSIVFSFIILSISIVSAQPQKIRVALVPFGFNAESPVYMQDGQDLAAGLTDKLSTVITELGRFEVVERVRLDAILKEQALGQTSLIDSSSALQVGSLTGAQLTVTGAINNYSQSSGVNSNNKVEWHSKISMSIRFIDAQSGVIKQAAQIETEGAGASASDARFQATSDAVNHIITKIKQLYPLKSQIVKKEGAEVYLNIGADLGVRKDMQFTTIDRGATILDASGNLLGTEQKETGIIKIIYVDKEYSRAKIIKDRGGINVGNEVIESSARTRIGIQAGFTYFPITAKRNTTPGSFIYYSDFWQSDYDTTILNFDEGKSASNTMGGYICLEMVDIANSAISTQFVFNFLQTNGELSAFLLDWDWLYNIRLIVDRLWIPVGIGASIGRFQNDYAYAKEAETDLRNIFRNEATASNEISCQTFGFFGFTGLRVQLHEHVDLFARAGYRWHLPLKNWEIKYTKIKSDDTESLVPVNVPAKYQPYNSVTVQGLDVRVGVAVMF